MGKILNFSVLWKHIVIGFYEESNSKTIFLNTIITYIAYKIYKFKMSRRIQNLEQSRLNLEESLKNSLNRDIDLLVSFSKIRISKEAVLCIRNML